MKKWTDDIVQALQELGGVASLEDIYRRLEEIRPERSPQWQATVRRSIQNHSSDASGLKRNNKNNAEKNLFYSVDGIGSGIWGLRNYQAHPIVSDIVINKKNSTNSTNSTTDDIETFTESIPQYSANNFGLTADQHNLDNLTSIKYDLEFPEGKEKFKEHKLKERNAQLVKLAKQYFKNKYGKLFCEVCHFDFEEKYGEIGEDFIEAHHIKPISEMKENDTTAVSDLVMVCSNCHRMLHRKRPWITKDVLKTLLKH